MADVLLHIPSACCMLVTKNVSAVLGQIPALRFVEENTVV
jgi:hypothetical protein